MRKGVILPPILFIFSCAPLVCKEAEAVRKSLLMVDVPSSYEANLFLRYRFFRMPIQLQKQEGRFTISGEGRYVQLSFNKLCLGGSCFDIPLSPDGVLFGRVLKGDEKVECSTAGISFEKEEGSVKARYVFREGKLSQIELYDSEKDTSIRFNYLEWSKEGYAKAIKVEKEELSLIIIVNSLKF